MYQNIIRFINAGLSPDLCDACGVYPKSIHCSNGGCTAFMINDGQQDLLAVSSSPDFAGTRAATERGDWIIAPLSHENAAALRKTFPFTAPAPVLKHPRTVGVGDRLGIATPGHIRVFGEYDAYPVFAQQSVRELHRHIGRHLSLLYSGFAAPAGDTCSH